MKDALQKLHDPGNFRVATSSRALRVFSSQRHLFLTLASVFLLVLPLFTHAQTAADLNEGTKIERDTANEMWRLKWWSREGRTYFVQHSEDLSLWTWMDVIISGNDSAREVGFDTNAGKFFMRLIHTDFPSTDPANEDWDDDGLINAQELALQTRY